MTEDEARRIEQAVRAYNALPGDQLAVEDYIAAETYSTTELSFATDQLVINMRIRSRVNAYRMRRPLVA